ncbi:MAG: hypothetical protein IKE55_12815 [Kiritimatiellae bacterium]|nr:hypothetical protein [Kiritimatiellia bacterium]
MAKAARLVAKAVVVAAMAARPSLAEDGGAVKGLAASAIAVDVRAEACRAVGSAAIGYSPSWSGVTDAGAYVVLQKVVNGETNTVATFAAGDEGECLYTASGEVSPFVRFIHRVYSPEGSEVGEPLVRDVAFGLRSGEGAAFAVDSRANSLQDAVDSGGPVGLAYSTAWATNAAAVSIEALQLSCSGGAPVATNDVFAAAADAEGETPMRGTGPGWWRLLCRLTDGSGNALLEYLTGEFKMNGGFTLIVR